MFIGAEGSSSLRILTVEYRLNHALIFRSQADITILNQDNIDIFLRVCCYQSFGFHIVNLTSPLKSGTGAQFIEISSPSFSKIASSRAVFGSPTMAT
jgi:hypothetical protein